MRIQRVHTLAFAVSEDEVKKAQKGFESGSKKILSVIRREKPEVSTGYLPMVNFKLTRAENVSKGILSSSTSKVGGTNFYVDLVYGELYHMKGHTIERYDLLNMIFDLPAQSIRVLGHLMRYGETLREDLDPGVVMELMHLGLIEIYTPAMKELFTLVVDDVVGESEGRHTIVKERVNVNFHLPKFSDKGYDLSSFLDTTDEMVEGYTKNSIKYSIDKLSTVLRDLFDASVDLESVTFMPYVRCEYLGADKHKRIPDISFPVCFTGKGKKHMGGIKITPISLSTEIGAKGDIPVERPTTNFSDVAGLDDVKEEIRDEIIYPILRPDLAKEFGRKGGGGILLYGPPGCGKTYIAKATIGECEASFFNIKISDLVGKGFEGGAQALHNIFERASRNSPSIIFIDEIEAIGGKRDANQQHSERMLIDQLLMEMDGVESMNENVLFIAATNSPWAIDPALKRAERFTKQLFIPPPDFTTRVSIFKIHTKDEPISPDIDFEKMADLTEEYSASDIKAICDSAAKIPWEEAVHGGVERQITMSDFIKAIGGQRSSLLPWYTAAYAQIEASGEIGLYGDYSKHILKHAGGVDLVEKSQVNFGDVGNLEDVKEAIRRSIIYPMLRPGLSREFGKKLGGGLLFYGPPGCGKTYIAKATAGECNASFFNVKITDILSSGEGESEKKIRDIFERAGRNTPSILFFDEIDAIAGRRDQMGITEVRLVNEFLTEMDGFKQTDGLMVIAATNAPWAIDPALRRSERFTDQIFLPAPGFNGRAKIFEIHCRDKPLSPDINFERLAELTGGYSSSDIKVICDFASEIPWEEALKGEPERKITMDDLLKTIRKRKSSLLPWIKMAKGQIEKSGEQEVYTDLYEFVSNFKMHGGVKFKKILENEKLRLTTLRDEKLVHLTEEKKDLEAKVEMAKHKYHRREIAPESVRNIIEDYEKQLIELDIGINKLRSGEPGREEDK